MSHKQTQKQAQSPDRRSPPSLLSQQHHEPRQDSHINSHSCSLKCRAQNRLEENPFVSLGHNSLKVTARESQTRGPHWNLSWQQLQTLRNSGSKHSSCLLITSQTENTPSQRSALAQPLGVGLGSTEKCRVQVPSPKKGLKGLLSPTQKIEGERKVPSCTKVNAWIK